MKKAPQTMFLAACLLVWAATVNAQQPAKPLTNDDIVSMVKSSLPEEVIVNAIQANDTSFDISATGLIALKKEGVSPKLMNVMLAAASSKKTAVATPPPPSTTGPSPQLPQVPQGQTNPFPGANPFAGSNPLASLPSGGSGQGLVGFMSAMKAAFGGGMPGVGATGSAAGFGVTVPTVAVVDGGVRKEFAYEKTFVAQTKAKSNSLTEIAKDSAMRSALDSSVNQTISSTQSHLGSSMSGSIAGSVIGDTSSSVMQGFLARRKASETLVWAVAGTTSSNVLSSGSPSLDVTYTNLAGVNPDEFEPAIVRLPLAQGAYRLVGATKEKTDPNQMATPQWQMYSSFIEDRVPTAAKKIASGHVQLSPSSPLPAGEYAVVLRPLSKDKKFSGADVTANRGDGLLFNSAWSFSVK